MPLQVPCPQCRQMTPFEGNPHRPFCSERCRRIDLGTWASGGYVIPGRSVEVEDDNVSDTADEEDSEDSE
ncbi:MAG: DNA gyrase inhibitor YacG [Deltaproteobacteria bacterium]|nr:DNA gyrase inhibitor YacG [Deltaproteobacteria bacterium]